MTIIPKPQLKAFWRVFSVDHHLGWPWLFGRYNLPRTIAWKPGHQLPIPFFVQSFRAPQPGKHPTRKLTSIADFARKWKQMRFTSALPGCEFYIHLYKYIYIYSFANTNIYIYMFIHIYTYIHIMAGCCQTLHIYLICIYIYLFIMKLIPMYTYI